LTIYRNRLTEAVRKKKEGRHEVRERNRDRRKERKKERYIGNVFASI
jgi:hypothetical protein